MFYTSGKEHPHFHICPSLQEVIQIEETSPKRSTTYYTLSTSGLSSRSTWETDSFSQKKETHTYTQKRSWETHLDTDKPIIKQFCHLFILKWFNFHYMTPKIETSSTIHNAQPFHNPQLIQKYIPMASAVTNFKCKPAASRQQGKNTHMLF